MNSNRGYSAMFGTADRNQQAKDNLIVAEKLAGVVSQRRKEEEEDQAKVAAMQEDIRKQTEQLLGYDKKAIREQSKMAFNLVKNKIAAYGGNYSRFMADGGRAVIENYRNSVLNSDLMVDYQENQKNMSRLLELEAKGMGHLINAVDRANMDSYRNNKGGKITYTGQLQDIELPDNQNYDWNTDAPAIDILKNKQNRFKIMNNYKLNHPNLGNPTEADLISYVKNNYSVRGNNYQRGMQEKQFNWQVENANREFDFRVAQYNDLKKEKRQASLLEQMKMNNENIALRNGVGDSSGGGTGSTGGVDAIGQEESLISNLAALTNQSNGKGFTIADLEKKGFSQNLIKSWQAADATYDLKPINIKDWKSHSSSYAGDGVAHQLIRFGLAGTYVPKNATLIKGLNTAALAQATFNNAGTQINIEGGRIKGLDVTKVNGILGGDGRLISESKGHIYSANSSGKPRDFIIKGVINGFKASNNGKEYMLVDKYGIVGGKSNLGKSDISLQERMGNSKAHLTQYLAIQDPKTNEILYMEAPVRNVGFQAEYQGLVPSDNIAKAKSSYKNTTNKFAQAKQDSVDKALVNKQGFTSILNDKESYNKVYKQSSMYGIPNKPTSRQPMITAYYATLAGMAQDLGAYGQFVNNDAFGNHLKEVQGIERLMKDSKYTPQQIIRQLKASDPSQADFYDKWLNNLIYISNN